MTLVCKAKQTIISKIRNVDQVDTAKNCCQLRITALDRAITENNDSTDIGLIKAF